jgi:predicted PurR-regulated permease PerM
MSHGFPLQKLRILMGGAVLYLARGVLIPLALAFLLTFFVHPIVSLLERLGARRVVSVTLVVLLLFSLLAGGGWAVLLQFSNLSHDVPRYRDNLIEKIAHVRGVRKGGALEQAQSAAKEVAQS